MPCTWNSALIRGFSSTSTLARTTSPSVASITCSMIGPSVQARTAPRGPQVDHDRGLLGAEHHVGLERRIGDIDGHGHRIREARLTVPVLGAATGSVVLSPEGGWSCEGRSGQGGTVEPEQATEGIDTERVTAWFADARPAGRRRRSRFDLIAGGHSNLTFGVTDTAGHHWVLRRPPLGQVLATAHDMGREHRIISALAPTDVPGGAGRRPVHRRVGQRRAVLRHGLRRRHRRARRVGGRSA